MVWYGWGGGGRGTSRRAAGVRTAPDGRLRRHSVGEWPSTRALAYLTGWCEFGGTGLPNALLRPHKANRSQTGSKSIVGMLRKWEGTRVFSTHFLLRHTSTMAAVLLGAAPSSRGGARLNFSDSGKNRTTHSYHRGESESVLISTRGRLLFGRVEPPMPPLGLGPT